MNETPSNSSVEVSAGPSVVRRVGHKRGGDTLGIAWLNGTLHIATFRRQQQLDCWASPQAVESLDDFAAALDQALAALDFGGTETFLVFEHGEFVHQAENAPGFSESTARAYLRGRIERHEKEHGSVLWVSQRTAAVRGDAMFLVHRLPAKFYHELNAVLLARRLDLARIIPIVVPLQQTLAAACENGDGPVLFAAAVGGATVVAVIRPGGELLFSRTILESWQVDPERVAVELNRSLLYARQQFASTVTNIRLLGGANPQAVESISAKCGAEVNVSTREGTVAEWLSEAAKLPPRHPVNLVAGHLRRKRQVRLVRRLLLAACWIGLALMSVDVWKREQELDAEKSRLETLAQSGAELEAEFERLTARNQMADQRRELIRTVTEDAMRPVAGKFLAYIATVLPAEGRLTDFSVRWDENQQQWMFRIDGVIDADLETARSMITKMRRELAGSPLRIRLAAGARNPVAVASNRESIASQQRFALEGGLLVN